MVSTNSTPEDARWLSAWAPEESDEDSQLPEAATGRSRRRSALETDPESASGLRGGNHVTDRLGMRFGRFFLYSTGIRIPRLCARLEYHSIRFVGGWSRSDSSFRVSVIDSVGQVVVHTPHPMHCSG